MPESPTPEMLKKMKMDTPNGPMAEPVSSSARNGASSQGRSRAATVEDEDVEMDDGVDRDFAPGGDADYFAEEDDEGRFFGGGLSKEQKDILNIFDKDIQEGVNEDVSALIVLCYSSDVPAVA